MLRDALGLKKVTLVPWGTDLDKRWERLVSEVQDADGKFYIQHPPLKYLQDIAPKIIVLVRDPRDIAISMTYYAMRAKTDLRKLEITWQMQNVPRDVSEKEMLSYFKEHGFNLPWWGSYLDNVEKIPHIVVWYEDMLRDTFTVLSRVLNSLGNSLPRQELLGIVRSRSFKFFSKGRERGIELKDHHYRKGVTGDWMNYFTSAENARFCEKYERYMSHFGYGGDW
jgi:hypothetical protein